MPTKPAFATLHRVEILIRQGNLPRAGQLLHDLLLKLPPGLTAADRKALFIAIAQTRKYLSRAASEQALKRLKESDKREVEAEILPLLLLHLWASPATPAADDGLDLDLDLLAFIQPWLSPSAGVASRLGVWRTKKSSNDDGGAPPTP